MTGGFSYTTHAAEGLALLVAQTGQGPATPDTGSVIKYCTRLGTHLVNSHVFRLPDNGKIIDFPKSAAISDLIPKYAHPFRLPYQSVAIEFDVTGLEISGDQEDFSRLVVLAQEGGGRISVASVFFSVMHQRWVPSNYVLELFGDGTFRARPAGLGVPADSATAMSDMHNEVLSVVSLIAALSCSNVTSTAVDPPAALNAKRVKHDRVPFFTYHVLEIPGGGNNGPPGGGTHASPRVHLRRGHVRRLTDKNVWVNAHVVGDKTKGMVTKEYAVH